MFKILLSELTYYRDALLFYLALCLVIFPTIWFGVRIESNQLPSQMIIFLVTVFSLGNIQSGFLIKSKRMRLFNTLPIARRSFGDLRFAFPLVTWLGVLVIFTFLYLFFSIFTKDLTRPSLSQLFLINGIILITQSIYLLNIDIRHLNHNRKLHFIVGVFYVCCFLLVLLPFYILVNFAGLFEQYTSLRTWLNSILMSSKVSLLSNVVGYLLYRGSYYVYLQRKDFIE